MTQNVALTRQRLDELWDSPTTPRLPLNGQRYVIFSDLHLGDGNAADDFRDNEEVLKDALNYYQLDNYTAILLGDIEEFWQFDLDNIVARYDATIYQQLRDLGPGKALRVYGNHDLEWRGLVDPITGDTVGYCAPEALKFVAADDTPICLLVHGHQGCLASDKATWFSRFFVRLFSYVEPFFKWSGLYSHKSATKSQITKKYEQVFYQWARDNHALIICGHTHRAIFAARVYSEVLKQKIKQLKIQNLHPETPTVAIEDNLRRIAELEEQLDEEKKRGRNIAPLDSEASLRPCYFNAGCGLYTDGLTAIEIEEDKIRLVKWEAITDITLRKVYDEGNIYSYYKQTADIPEKAKIG